MVNIPREGKVIFLTSEYERNYSELVAGAVFKYKENGDFLWVNDRWLSCRLEELLAYRKVELYVEYESKEIEELHTMGYRHG